jgi:hypothetical protein
MDAKKLNLDKSWKHVLVRAEVPLETNLSRKINHFELANDFLRKTKQKPHKERAIGYAADLSGRLLGRMVAAQAWSKSQAYFTENYAPILASHSGYRW